MSLQPSTILHLHLYLDGRLDQSLKRVSSLLCDVTLGLFPKRCNSEHKEKDQLGAFVRSFLTGCGRSITTGTHDFDHFSRGVWHPTGRFATEQSITEHFKAKCTAINLPLNLCYGQIPENILVNSFSDSTYPGGDVSGAGTILWLKGRTINLCVPIDFVVWLPTAPPSFLPSSGGNKVRLMQVKGFATRLSSRFTGTSLLVCFSRGTCRCYLVAPLTDAARLRCRLSTTRQRKHNLWQLINNKDSKWPFALRSILGK